MRRTFARLGAGALVLLAAAACQQDPTLSADAAGVVARFGDLVVTVQDVDARVLALPPSERPAPGEDLEDWYEEQIRELAVERRLLEDAEASDLDNDPEYEEARRAAERTLGLQLCLSSLRPDIAAVTEDDLRAAWSERDSSFVTPERRALYNLFLRSPAPGQSAARKAEIESLRQRTLSGEGFLRLAREHSDSESRHRDGAVGWVRRGSLPESVERIVFSLEEGVPSDPVETRDGWHLFYVEQILPAREYTFEEVRSALAEQLIAQRRETVIQELETEIEPPEDALLLDRDAFLEIVRAAEPRAVVLRVADTTLTLGELGELQRARIRSMPRDAGARPPRAWSLLEQQRRSELLHHHCTTTGKIPAAELAGRLGVWREKALVDLRRQRMLVEVAERDPERLRLFYEGEIGFFSSPPTWHLKRLRLPLGADASGVMARLEGVAGSKGDLERLLRELGGEIDDLGPRTLPELRALEPKMAALVAPLAVGELSAPYRTQATLEILELVARREAQPRLYDDVRELVAASFVAQNASEMYDRLRGEILASAELEILPRGLATLRESTTGQMDISVDQLDAALSEL